MQPDKQTYPLETAGNLMQTSIPVVGSGHKVGKALEELRASAAKLDTLDYIYVVDEDERLCGVVTMKDLLASDQLRLIKEIMNPEVVSVNSDADQEMVVQLALERQLKAVPVVGAGGALLGVVPSHLILKALQQEQEEDVLKEAGIANSYLDHHTANILRQSRQRLPWLMLGMLGGVAAAFLIGMFEAALEREVLLAAFIPTIVYLADAVGVQVQTVYIRLLARKRPVPTLRYLYREFITSLIVAAVLSLSTLGLIWVWFNNATLAVIVAVSAAISVVFASLIAIAMPWVFFKLKFDPAVASGPLATIVRDVSSILIYFLIAQWLTGMVL